VSSLKGKPEDLAEPHTMLSGKHGRRHVQNLSLESMNVNTVHLATQRGGQNGVSLDS
jgi:hypothetical protein